MERLLKQMIAKHGAIYQCLQIAEESAELAKELIKASKLRIHKTGVSDDLFDRIAEEWADVEIVMQYLPLLFPSIVELKEEIKKEKIKRMEGLV